MAPDRIARRAGTRRGRAARLAAVAAVMLGAAAGCGDRAEPAATDAASRIGYDQAWQIATHNSYWVDRGTPTAR